MSVSIMNYVGYFCPNFVCFYPHLNADKMRTENTDVKVKNVKTSIAVLLCNSSKHSLGMFFSNLIINYG